MKQQTYQEVPIRQQHLWQEYIFNCDNTKHKQAFSCHASKFECKICHFTSQCFKSKTTSTSDVNDIKTQPVSHSDEEWFIVTIKQNEDEWLKGQYHHFFTDFYIPIQCHQRRHTKLAVKRDTGADTLVMLMKPYMSLTRNNGLEHLGPPDVLHKEFGGGTAKNICIAILHACH